MVFKTRDWIRSLRSEYGQKEICSDGGPLRTHDKEGTEKEQSVGQKKSQRQKLVGFRKSQRVSYSVNEVECFRGEKAQMHQMLTGSVQGGLRINHRISLHGGLVDLGKSNFGGTVGRSVFKKESKREINGQGEGVGGKLYKSNVLERLLFI